MVTDYDLRKMEALDCSMKGEFPQSMKPKEPRYIFPYGKNIVFFGTPVFPNCTEVYAVAKHFAEFLNKQAPRDTKFVVRPLVDRITERSRAFPEMVQSHLRLSSYTILSRKDYLESAKYCLIPSSGSTTSKGSMIIEPVVDGPQSERDLQDYISILKKQI